MYCLCEVCVTVVYVYVWVCVYMLRQMVADVIVLDTNPPPGLLCDVLYLL